MTNQAQRPPGTPRSASPRRIAPNPGDSADNLGLIVLDQFRTVASVHCRHSSGLSEWPLPTCAVKRRRFPAGESPARLTVPAGSNWGRHGGDEMSEALG